jgi:hypothetical protein
MLWLLLIGVVSTPLLAPPASRASLEAFSLATPTATPIPWDDIQVSDQNGGANCSNEALVVTGENVYVVYDHPTGEYLARSTDGGHSFLPSVAIFEGNNGSLPALARREGARPEEEDLYVTFMALEGLFFSRSPDGGTTWLLPTTVTNITPAMVPKIVVDSSGTIYVTWHHTTYEQYGHFYLSRSSDGGLTWSTPIQIQTELYSVYSRPQMCSLLVQGDTLLFAWVGQPQGGSTEVMFTHSTDGGATWSDPVRVDDAVDHTVGVTVDLAIAADGVIYAAWSDDRLFGGGHELTYVNHSTDGGQSWSPGVRVDDAGDCVENSISGAITMDDQNRLHVALIDGRNYCEEPFYFGWTDIFYTYSTDGGLTWSVDEQINNPIPYDGNYRVSLQAGSGMVYTTWTRVGAGPDQIWLDLHDPSHPTPPPTPTPSPTPLTPTATPTEIPSPTTTPTSPPAATPTPTPSPTSTASATPTPSASATATPIPSASVTPVPSPTGLATPTTSATPGASPTMTPPIGEWRVYLPRVHVRERGRYFRRKQ